MNNPFFRPERYVNGNLYVKPVYGWGWTSSDSSFGAASQRDEWAPCPFHFRVEEFVPARGRLTGGLGRVLENGHPFFDLQILFELRSEGTWNFTNQVGYYNLYLGFEGRDVLLSNDGQDEFSVPITGYGFIAQSREDIEKCESRELEKWEIMRDAMSGSGDEYS